ncbi:MAG TPA: TIGR02206 family membrane protein [Levilinea sp.]|nr:TIGR02206 family membrane protein [Levilinea sp.]
MAEYFARDYSGGDFVLFGRDHLIGLALIALACLAIWLLRRRWTPRGQKITRWVFLGVIYACEGSWHIWMLATGQWNIQVMLPLWVCSLTAWTMPLLLIWRSRRYYEWAYFMGILGALMALLTPDLMNYGFPHFRFIEFMTLHGMLVIATVYMTVVEGFRPTWGSLGRVWLFTNLYWLFCAGVNSLIGSNYLYTHGKLPTPSLLDLLGPHPWYLLWMEVIGIALALLMYLPYALRDRAGRKALARTTQA